MLIILLSILLAFVTFAMSMAILLQEPKQAGLSGSFGMGGDQMLGAGSPNALSKFTGFLAVGFLVLCLGIGLLKKQDISSSDIQMQEGDTRGVTTSISDENAPAPGEGGVSAEGTIQIPPADSGLTPVGDPPVVDPPAADPPAGG